MFDLPGMMNAMTQIGPAIETGTGMIERIAIALEGIDTSLKHIDHLLEDHINYGTQMTLINVQDEPGD